MVDSKVERQRWKGEVERRGGKARWKGEVDERTERRIDGV
jgi:hypothetical protein